MGFNSDFKGLRLKTQFKLLLLLLPPSSVNITVLYLSKLRHPNITNRNMFLCLCTPDDKYFHLCSTGFLPDVTYWNNAVHPWIRIFVHNAVCKLCTKMSPFIAAIIGSLSSFVTRVELKFSCWKLQLEVIAGSSVAGSYSWEWSLIAANITVLKLKVILKYEDLAIEIGRM